MTSLQFQKNSALPGTLSPDTVYLVKQSDNTVKMFVSNSTGSKAMPVVTGEEELDPFLLMGVD